MTSLDPKFIDALATACLKDYCDEFGETEKIPYEYAFDWFAKATDDTLNDREWSSYLEAFFRYLLKAGRVLRH